MKARSIIRNLIIVLVVAGIGYGGYTFFLKGKFPKKSTGGLETTAGFGSGTTDPNLDANTALANDQIGTDFLTTLLSVKTIKLDSAIFTNPAFTSLQDFSRPLLPDPNPGRPNPFAPLGSDGTAISTQVSTGNTSFITQTSTTLNGTLTVGDASVMRWFDYGTTITLGTLTTKKPQLSPGVFTETISGLLPNTTYYVKAMASIAGTTVAGSLVTWKTAQAAAR